MHHTWSGMCTDNTQLPNGIPIPKHEACRCCAFEVSLINSSRQDRAGTLRRSANSQARHMTTTHMLIADQQAENGNQGLREVSSTMVNFFNDPESKPKNCSEEIYGAMLTSSHPTPMLMSHMAAEHDPHSHLPTWLHRTGNCADRPDRHPQNETLRGQRPWSEQRPISRLEHHHKP